MSMTAYGLRWQSIVDFVVLAPSIYLLLRWSRDARALRVTIGILGLEVGALVAGQLDLVITVWVLHAAAVGAGVVLIVLFQPELRHALNTLEVVLKRSERRGALSQALEVVSAAAFSLAGAGRGALLVLTRHDSVNELLPGGVPLGGHVSPEILEAIFRKVSPVHDGATIVEGDRITRVGALLPLSQNEKLPRTWGTRHRAGMGLAERSDAIVVVASEERGDVTLMHDGAFRRVESADAMLIELKTLFAPEPTVRSTRYFRRSELLLQSVAIALAVVIVAATSLVAGTIVRVRTVPIEAVRPCARTKDCGPVGDCRPSAAARKLVGAGVHGRRPPDGARRCSESVRGRSRRSAFGSQDRCRSVSRWRRSLRSESRFAFDQSRTPE